MRKIILMVLIIIILISNLYVWASYFFKETNNGQELNIGILKGKVILHTGNCMPIACGPNGCPPSSCFSEGVKRKISIREPKQANLKTFPSFYNNDGDLIKTIESNGSGDFITTLPAGNYSLFVIENGTGYEEFFPSKEDIFNEYCSEINIHGFSCFVKIEKNHTIEFDLQLRFASS